MRLIDADALVNGYDVRQVTEYDEAGFSMNYKAVPLDVIEEAPTVEVVGEPVIHSIWIKHAAAQNTSYWTCLNCDTMGSPRWKRCPVCEAKMTAEVEG